MGLNNNFLSKVFDWLGEAFEKFNPSAYRFLGATLPYLTPLPVASLTSSSARAFLGFDPWIAFTFVFSLEGMGLWFTSLLVDAVVDWIRSRNWKTFAIVAVLAGAVGAYIYLLVSLNVLLHTESEDTIYRQVVTLLCFLPLISGIGNGYYKIKLKNDAAETDNKQYQRELDERKRKEANDLKLKSKLIKAGINPLQAVQYNTQSPTIEPVAKKSDWRLLTDNEKHQVRTSLTIQEIMDKYDVSRSTAFGWKSK